MPARSQALAADEFVAPLQRAVSCVTTAVLRSTTRRSLGEQRQVYFGSRVSTVNLRGSRRLSLSVEIRYTVVEVVEERRAWMARIEGYRIQLYGRDLRELFAFHWHPDSRSPITFPHVHIGARLDDLDLSKLHLPTGVLTLPQIVRFAIEELGVEPLREDWHAALGIA